MNDKPITAERRSMNITVNCIYDKKPSQLLPAQVCTKKPTHKSVLSPSLRSNYFALCA